MTQQLLKRPRQNSAFQQLMSVHWVMAGCYLLLFSTGPFMARLTRGTPLRNEFYDFHKAMGILVMALLTLRILILLRVWWRKYVHRLPKFSPEWAKNVAHYILLYIFMFAVPVSGIFFSNSFKENNVRFFGMPLPDFFPKNSVLVDLGRSMHFWLAYTFLAFILLHLFAQKKVLIANWRRLKSALKYR
jgi:cytochrome b561